MDGETDRPTDYGWREERMEGRTEGRTEGKTDMYMEL